jgi:hypothetical protein
MIVRYLKLTSSYYMPRLAYLHEGLEPKVVDRDIKSSNILLDQQWNAKGAGKAFVLRDKLCNNPCYGNLRVSSQESILHRATQCTFFCEEKATFIK